MAIKFKEMAEGALFPLRIYTVSELTAHIRDILEGEFPEVLVEGEVSNLRIPLSGHVFFTLKDQKSQLKAVIFKTQTRFLKFELENGQHVLCWGRISVYEPKGEYRLVVDYMEPKGLGALQLAFEQLKRKLEAEGLFDPSHKRPLPLLPQRIGIVTSPRGAVIKDMLNVLKRRFENLHIVIYPVRVQGEGAAEEIAEAIDYLGKSGLVDVIIVARGGGSIEDLWAFNEEIVVRSIFRCPVPVISAIGHETDYTISDFVADLRAPTPSAAAEMVVKQKEDLREKIHLLHKRLCNAIRHILSLKEEKLKSLEKNLEDPRKKLKDLMRHTLNAEKRLVKNMLFIIERKTQILNASCKVLLTHTPQKRCELLKYKLFSLTSRLKRGVISQIKIKESNLKLLAGKLNDVNPLTILSRGYSITWLLPRNVIVKNAAQVSIGDRVRIVLAKGELECLVKDKRE